MYYVSVLCIHAPRRARVGEGDVFQAPACDWRHRTVGDPSAMHDALRCRCSLGDRIQPVCGCKTEPVPEDLLDCTCQIVADCWCPFDHCRPVTSETQPLAVWLTPFAVRANGGHLHRRRVHLCERLRVSLPPGGVGAVEVLRENVSTRRPQHGDVECAGAMHGAEAAFAIRVVVRSQIASRVSWHPTCLCKKR